MSQFRKKPVVIEAVQFAHDGVNAGEVLNFTGGIIAELREPHIAIKTMEGVMLANPGDWIIRGVKGEFYPCKPEIFAATYEPVGEAALAAPLAVDALEMLIAVRRMVTDYQWDSAEDFAEATQIANDIIVYVKGQYGIGTAAAPASEGERK